MTEQDKSIEEVRAMVSEVGIRLLDAYYRKIKELYSSSNGQRQRWVIGRLESLVSRLEREQNPLSNPFDLGIAREIREHEHISQLKLSLQINTSVKSISRYETADYFFKNERLSKTEIRYLEWLKERGYNPFNL
ncbi:MAG TPA: hypothetical protein VJJ52_00480 [Candidatus Nanoarchaeia archaeon]|nr:hypothetical protein [Candidatus Nanoarchaeia archaeon]